MGILSSDNISGFAQSKAGLEPHRTYDFNLQILGIPNNGESDLNLSVDTGALPNPSFEEITLGYGNDSIYIAGKAVVEPITFQFKDFMEPATARILWNWYLQHYDPETGVQHLARQYKKSAILWKLPPNSVTRSGGRRWRLEGLWIQNANFGSLDFNTSDIIRIECAFRFDRAIVDSGQLSTGISDFPGKQI